jgi:hypothetical protein
VVVASLADQTVSGAFGVLGVIVGGVITLVGAKRERRRERERTLQAAATRVLARVEKLALALRTSNENMKKNEKWLLGGDLDHYAAAIAGLAGRGGRVEDHWAIHERLLPVLGDEFSDLDAAESALQELRTQPIGARAWRLSISC